MYAAFERAGNSEKAFDFASRQRKVHRQILEKDPEDLLTKTRLAMTIVMTENPMSGIMLLREVIDTNPTFREAILNLGLLSIQSGQFDRGEERFLDLLNQNPEDYEAMLYLAICQREVGNQEGAKKLFETVANAENVDIALKAAATEYLQEN
eukprot:gnl/MRDRNA2_/MRDRNA2_72954_c0_seq1.p1 gnl/MRDRNA2_/MRDRNA2_72954_c0~~gnl/MRDRNA2_/MRDRNA2_72954_c0_seq1.p1  ORF type:complete len:165 (+),score=26.31 gnl/MRDRNA2_/MRDRNA2_72954_c0_seq1:40-495(+)